MEIYLLERLKEHHLIIDIHSFAISRIAKIVSTITWKKRKEREGRKRRRRYQKEERKREGRDLGGNGGESEMQRLAKSSVGLRYSSSCSSPGRRPRSRCSTLTNDLVRGHI